MSANIYHYRLIQSSWGIAIDITCVVNSHMNIDIGNLHLIEEGLWLSVEISWIDSSEIRYLVKGIQLVAKELLSKVEIRPIVIHVIELKIYDTDYQVEGISCAIAGWLAREYGLNYVHPQVQYDKHKNRYIFNFDRV